MRLATEACQARSGGMGTLAPGKTCLGASFNSLGGPMCSEATAVLAALCLARGSRGGANSAGGLLLRLCESPGSELPAVSEVLDSAWDCLLSLSCSASQLSVS